MKCKKLFALLLSLCMILSTFVAVSAEEQIYVAGNGVTLADISKNFDAADAEVLAGAGISASNVVDPAGVRAGMVFGGAITTGSTGYIGVKLPTTCLYAGDIVEISLDAYSSADWAAKDAGSTQGVLLRGGNSWAPTGSWCQVLANGAAVPANTWTTLTNKFTVTKTIAGNGVWLQVRPDVALDYFYIDNLQVKITGGRETVVDMNMSMDDAATGLLKGSSITSLTYADGIATAAVGGSGNNAMVGVKLVDVDGAVFSPANGEVVEWEVRLNPSASFTPVANGTTGILMRNGGTYPPSSTPYTQVALATAIPANTWTTVKGTWVCNQDGYTNTYMNIRPDKAMTLQIDYIKVKVLEAATIREDGWVAADMSVPASVTPSNLSWIDTIDDGVKVNLSEASTIASASRSSLSYAYVIPVTPIAKADAANYKLFVDIKTDNIYSSEGVLYTNNFIMNARVVDNTTEVANGRTLGYVLNDAVPANQTEAVTVVYDLADMVANGGSSSATEFKMITLQMNMEASIAHYEATQEEGYVELTNIRLVKKGTKLDYSADKSGNSVILTIRNAQDEDYKVVGNLFVATYDGNEMMKFAKEEVEKTVAADGSETVTVNFDEALTGPVRVFFWEADGSLTPIKDWTL